MPDLTNILDRHEDDHLEAKSAKGGFPDSFWETFSAFANSDGGTIPNEHDNLSDKIVEQIKLSGSLRDKLPITEALIGKLADICIYVSQHPHSAKENIAAFIKRGDETAKKHLQTLVAIGMITPEGGNKNRTYSITLQTD